MAGKFPNLVVVVTTCRNEGVIKKIGSLGTISIIHDTSLGLFPYPRSVARIVRGVGKRP